MEFLLELYGEEIPARLQKTAVSFLETSLQDAFSTAGISFSATAAWVTPCRLGFVAYAVHQQPLPPMEKKGPLLSASADALAGFLRANGLYSFDQCFIKDSPKGAYYVYRQDSKTPDLAISLVQALLHVLSRFPWETSMVWQQGQEKPWVRPLHRILCLLDGAVLPFDFLGISSSSMTVGHKFLAAAAFSVASFADYQQKLRDAFVLIHFSDRLESIHAQTRALASVHGYSVQAAPSLCAEIAGLVEYPFVVLGTFDAQFLDLPQELLILVMNTHQRYLALLDSSSCLVPYFLCVSNIPDSRHFIVHGNARVLRARFHDGLHLFSNDGNHSLEERLPLLKDVLYLETPQGMRSLWDKVSTMHSMAKALASCFELSDDKDFCKAALLCKSDLVSSTVMEFPELQGIIGGVLAKRDGLSEPIAIAIAQHYLPLGTHDTLPIFGLPSFLALVDKLDTLIFFFSNGIIPTSSSDPYGLRRAALGILRLLLTYPIPCTLKALLSIAAPSMPVHVQDTLLGFMDTRLRIYLKGLGHDARIIAMVLDYYPMPAIQLHLLPSFLRFLEDYFFHNPDGQRVIILFKRIHSILPADFVPIPITAESLPTKHDIALYHAYIKLPVMDTATFSLESLEYLSHILLLEEPLSTFFDSVMVHDFDSFVAKQRLSLLYGIYNSSFVFGDIRLLFS